MTNNELGVENKKTSNGVKKSSTIFLQIVIALFGAGLIALMLIEPHLEGVNENATSFSQIYFDDPFLAYAYIGSIPFFVVLYKAFKILGYIRQNKTFSEVTLKALKTIKYCALITAAAIIGADVYIRIAAQKSGDDSAGAIALGIVATFISFVIAAAAIVFERVIKNAVDLIRQPAE